MWDDGHSEEDEGDDEDALFFSRAIEETRANLAEHRSRGKGFKDRYCKLRPSLSDWLLGVDVQFTALYAHQAVLYEQGTVVWGHTLQANDALFRRGSGDRPAAFLYSADPAIDAQPQVLAGAARALLAGKGTSTEPDLAEISRKLADEYERDWKLPVPTRLSGGLPCHYATGLVFRRHLPDAYLAHGLFPMLICPERSPVAFILPSRWWSRDFIDHSWR